MLSTQTTIYQDNGYTNREDYLLNLAKDYRVPLNIVESLANMLGQNEDFDGLISALQDAECMIWENTY